MTRMIYKYVIDAPGKDITLPPGARVVHTAMQNGSPHIWVEQTLLPSDGTYSPPRVFTIVGTGQAIPEGADYVGTVHQQPYVWHIYELASL